MKKLSLSNIFFAIKVFEIKRIKIKVALKIKLYLNKILLDKIKLKEIII